MPLPTGLRRDRTMALLRKTMSAFLVLTAYVGTYFQMPKLGETLLAVHIVQAGRPSCVSSNLWHKQQALLYDSRLRKDTLG